MEPGNQSAAGAADLLARLRAFFFPGGEDGARRVKAIKAAERGQFRTAPAARWASFTAEEEIDATGSRFHWTARFKGGGMGFFEVTDSYEAAHGQLVVRLGGVIPVTKVVGPDADMGELQRYLAAIPLCPPIVLNHPSLQWDAVAPLTLRVRDSQDPTGAAVDLSLNEQGCPIAGRADRPRAAGKKAILTPWSGSGTEFRERDGIRVATRLEASWLLPEGPFTYFQGEVVSYVIVR